MLANRARGDAALRIDGRPVTLRLTLGALAELEAAFGCASIDDLAVRLKAGRAGDLLIVLAALVRGGGGDGDADALARADIDPVAAAQAIAKAFEGV
jgi:hypothetical protein